MPLSAMDDTARPVDWWFMYKVAGKGRGPGGKKPAGTEYVYFDSKTPATGRLVLSPDRVNANGALPNTLKQVYGTAADHRLGWFFYNDEDPITGKVVGSRGHTKGVLAFDLGSNSAFWLIQSTPKFPPKGNYGFPNTGMPNAQTLLCITLKDADTARVIANQMYKAQQPYVYLASQLPTGLPTNDPNDMRARLMQNTVDPGTQPGAGKTPFRSRGGTTFICMAKNKAWGHDFYNDLVGPSLKENLEVETWEHDPTPGSADSDKIHHVVDMKGVDLRKIDIPYEWPEPDDHAKLCISDLKESVHYVCVGDMNFTLAQRKRGGGTVAFQCEPLWKSLSACLVGVTSFPLSSATEEPPADAGPTSPEPRKTAKAPKKARAGKEAARTKETQRTRTVARRRKAAAKR